VQVGPIAEQLPAPSVTLIATMLLFVTETVPDDVHGVVFELVAGSEHCSAVPAPESV